MHTYIYIYIYICIHIHTNICFRYINNSFNCPANFSCRILQGIMQPRLEKNTSAVRKTSASLGIMWTQLRSPPQTPQLDSAVMARGDIN